MSFALKAGEGSWLELSRVEPRCRLDAEASADAGLGIPLSPEPRAWSVPGESAVPPGVARPAREPEPPGVLDRER